jgi:exosortase C (VPDSG-CTERM-specific)
VKQAKEPEPVLPTDPPVMGAPPPQLPAQVRRLALLAIGLAVCFAQPLYQLGRFASQSDLYSHILLVPFVSLYLAWLKKPFLPAPSEPNRKLAALPFALGLLLLFSYEAAVHSGAQLEQVDSLAWTSLSFVLFFVSICVFCLGRETLSSLAFPLCFLVFIVPFPAFLVGGIETFLQYTSAITAHALFVVTGMPVFRDGLSFQLPGMHLQVAPECSGIHSTLVLFITSLVAGELFLRAPWKRALLAVAVIPLGIIRNAVRICTIGFLCVHVSPEMINSPIHRRGGPLFFLVSLVPLFLLLHYLRRSELKRKTPTIVTKDS